MALSPSNTAGFTVSVSAHLWAEQHPMCLFDQQTQLLNTVCALLQLKQIGGPSSCCFRLKDEDVCWIIYRTVITACWALQCGWTATNNAVTYKSAFLCDSCSIISGAFYEWPLGHVCKAGPISLQTWFSIKSKVIYFCFKVVALGIKRGKQLNRHLLLKLKEALLSNTSI